MRGRDAMEGVVGTQELSTPHIKPSNLIYSHLTFLETSRVSRADRLHAYYVSLMLVGDHTIAKSRVGKMGFLNVGKARSCRKPPKTRGRRRKQRRSKVTPSVLTRFLLLTLACERDNFPSFHVPIAVFRHSLNLRLISLHLLDLWGYKSRM